MIRPRPLTPPCVQTAGVPWTVYILRCGDDTLYTGCTNDLARRLRMHEKGRVKYTRARQPIALAYSEPASDKSAALRREAAIKRLSRKDKLRLLNQPAEATTPPSPPRQPAASKRKPATSGRKPASPAAKPPVTVPASQREPSPKRPRASTRHGTKTP